MGLFGRRRESRVKARGLTAAATLVDLTDDTAAKREAGAQKKRPLQWQRDAWRYYDDLSEVRSYGRWMGDTQSRVRLYPAIAAVDTPEQEPIAATEADGVNPAETQLALDLLDRLRSPDGDRQEIQRVFGLNLAIPGETWLVGTDEDEEYADSANPTGERWRAFSNEELVVTMDGRWAVEPWPNARESELEILDPDTSTLIRIYRRHGRRRAWPDSAMRSANLICEELLLATQAIMGTLRSRIPAGILPVPEDLELGDGADDNETEADTGDDQVLRELIKHLSTPLSDPRSASALVPYLLKVPPEYLDKLKLIDLAKAIDPATAARIEQLIRRFAIAVDMPPEALTGTAGLNHWSAWLVGEDGVRSHVEPYTALYCDALTTRYLRPRLAAAGVADVDRWLIRWDARDCIAHPDQKQNAEEGWDRIVISDQTYVTALGFNEDDMPDEEERARRLEEQKTLKATDAPVGGENVTKGPPGGVSASSALVASSARQPDIGRRWARIEARLQRDLIVDADAALRRVLERAQARVRSAAQKDKAARAVAAAVSLERLAPALGPDEIARLGLTDDELFAGGLGALQTHFYGWTEQARLDALAELRRLGVEPDPDLLADYDATARTNRDEGWATLAAGLTAAAGALLYSTSGPGTPQPQGEFDALLSASPRDIREALTVAGGGPHQLELALIGERGGRIPETSGGILAGQDFAAFLKALPDFDASGWLWEVGAPTNPFEPHQALEGLEFTDWGDPALAADPSEFPFVSVYAPQDHDGCQCIVVPTGTVTVDDEEPPEEAG